MYSIRHFLPIPLSLLFNKLIFKKMHKKTTKVAAANGLAL